jgi:GT2 family glycosyltransferase
MVSQSVDVTYSIVSHGQGELIKNLLSDIKSTANVTYEILLTINIPEDEFFLVDYKDLPLVVIRNEIPMGFGANHNQAYSQSRGNFFSVVNPDIRLPCFDIRPLINQMLDLNVGVVSPAVFSSDGFPQDNARKFPTIYSLILRKLGVRKIDYSYTDQSLEVDWVAGMFMVFSKESFQLVGGFDPRYFMYMEDADICRRLFYQKKKVLIVPAVRVLHDAQRASQRSLRHLIWHCKSAKLFLR